MGKRVIVTSDIHAGSTVGLWPGEHPIEGGGLYSCNRPQQWLLACWQHQLDEVASLDEPPILVLNGDVIQGVSMKDGQLISNNIAVQVSAAERLLRPLVEKCSRVYFIRGTEWHEGKASDNVERLAECLGAEKDPSSGMNTWPELYLSLNGDVIHFAHHVSVGSVPWYEATVPLRDTLMQIAELTRFYGARAPNLKMVVRSHRHRFIHVDAPPDIQAVVTPSWQLPNAFAFKKSASLLPQIGYVTIEQTDKGLRVDRQIYQLPEKHIEVVEG